jgi:hypothetical protein
MKFLAICLLLAEGLLVNGFARANAPESGKANKTGQSAGKDGKVAAEHASSNNSSAVAASTPPLQHHAKLDVGFASFEKSVLEQISSKMQASLENLQWTKKVEAACMDNVTQELSKGLKSQVLPIKQSIGKTWMALPEDDQKDTYVSQLRSSYESVFADTTKTIAGHLDRSLTHLQNLQVHSLHKKKFSDDELLTQCKDTIASNLLNERCYDVGGEQHLKNAKSFLQVDGTTKSRFCMPSVLEAMVRRLHDSEGLIGMTMQFEAKSMALQPAPGAIDDIVQQAAGTSK